MDARAARLVLQGTAIGVLSWSPSARGGAPAAWPTRFVLSLEGRPIFDASSFATPPGPPPADTSVCLTVHGEGAGGVDEAAVSLTGRAVAVPAELREAALHRRRALLAPTPDDAALLWIDPASVVARIGREPAHAVTREEWLLPTPAWRAQEDEVLSHMNADHRDAMRTMCQHFLGAETRDPVLAAVDPEGLHIVDGERRFHLAFDKRCDTLDDVHHATVRLARRARGAA